MTNHSGNPNLSGPDVEQPYQVALRVLDEATSPEALLESEGAGSGLHEYLDGLEEAGIELTPEDIAAALDVLAGRYDHSQAVLEDSDGYRYNKLGTYRPWKVISGVMLREVQRGHIDPGALTPLLHASVSELLPNEAVRVTEGNEAVNRMLRRYPWLSEYVSLPSVPDDRIGPSLHEDRYTKLVQPSDITKKWKEGRSSDIDILLAKEMLNDHAKRDRFHTGITESERKLILLRSMFARDVKLLALGAELLQNPSLQFDERNALVLPSGTTIGVVPGQEQKALALLKADQWHGRSQIHDRVHRASTETGEYVLKERKTQRHEYRWDDSVISVTDSKGEVAIATEFMQRGIVHEGDVSAAWERPVGFVQDPSGFEFAIFEHEADLVSLRKVRGALSEAIKQRPQLHQAEFDAVRASAEGGVEISWDDFAEARAQVMEEHAKLLLRKTMVEAGYVDGDKETAGIQLSDYAYRIHSSETELRLEIVGFDFEYFVKLDPDALQRCKEHFNFVIDNRTNIYKEWGMIGPHKPIAEAAKGIVKYALENGAPVLPEKFE